MMGYADMAPSVSNVCPEKNYCLEIYFDNGEEGILDMKPYLNFGVFKTLKDESNFH